ncbi:hypothetical protein M0R19_05905 [Candidatus Pacearchaeota archaeon]|jgi:hypothetical protein|nr:hypothetical protein [Candidatus Pacearchaeota archaeon]
MYKCNQCHDTGICITTFICSTPPGFCYDSRMKEAGKAIPCTWCKPDEYRNYKYDNRRVIDENNKIKKWDAAFDKGKELRSRYAG